MNKHRGAAGGVATPQEQLRERHLRRIIDTLRRRRESSQTDLARETNLRASTVSNLVRELRRENVVTTVGRGTSGAGGGKPPVIIGLRPERGVFLGLLWDSGAVAVGVTDFAGDTVVERAVASLDGIGPGDVAGVIGMIHRLVHDQIERSRSIRGSLASKILGIGAAVGSVVDGRGRIRRSADFPWTLDDPAATFAEIEGVTDEVPVVIENDANCIALAVRQGMPEAVTTILGLSITGKPVSVGAGIVFENHLLRGRSGSAGELLDDAPVHSRDEVDLACATAVRMIDPDVVALALPDGVDRTGFPRLGQTVSGRELHIMNHVTGTLHGAAYLAYREHTERIIQGGSERYGR